MLKITIVLVIASIACCNAFTYLLTYLVFHCQDGRYFLQLVQSVEDRINALCVEAEADMNCAVPEEG